MSSGLNAPKRLNVAASTLIKASGRFLNGGGGGSTRNMKRQKLSGPGASWESEESGHNNNQDAVALDSSSTESPKSKKKFVGVRQRPSGRWVAEIKDTTQKIRLWLGTFDSAEEGAKAYDSAARALRGNNTRTNFLPASASEGTAPMSKAARLIRLRRIAAANSKLASDKELEQKDVNLKMQDETRKVEQVISPVVRQDFQQSSNLTVDDSRVKTLNSPPSPPKPAPCLISRKLISKSEQEAVNDQGTVDNPPRFEVGSFLAPGCLPSKQAPQKSIASDIHSNVTIDRHLAASLQGQYSSSLLSLPSSSINTSFDSCMQPNSCDDGGAISLVNNFEESATTDLKFNASGADKLKLESSFSAFTVNDNHFVQPSPPITFHVALEARQSSRFDNRVGEAAYPAPEVLCTTNRDYVSDKELARYRDDTMSLDDDMCRVTESPQCCEAGAASTSILKERMEGMEYTSADMYGIEMNRIPDRFILRERDFSEFLLDPEIPWPDYAFNDVLDLGCLSSGAYTSAFDFLAGAMDRDSCTSSVLEEQYLSDDSSEFLLTMQYNQSGCSTSHESFQECVLLTEPASELGSYCLSPESLRQSGPPLSPQETTHIPSSLLWRAWDGQLSTGSTETSTISTDIDGDGECSSQDQALWSSMDLAPLCIVA